MDHLKEKYSQEPDIAELLTSDAKTDLHIHTCYSDGELTPQQVVSVSWVLSRHSVQQP